MEKKGILAIILTFIIIIGWSFIQSKLFPPEPVKEVKKEQVAPLEQKKEALQTTPVPSKESKSTPESKATSNVKEVAKQEVSVETKNYWAVLTNQDAKLKHFKLKKYKDRVEESSITITLTRLVEGILGKKIEEPKKPEPLDLINTNEEEGLPLGLSSQYPFVAGNWNVDKEKLSLVNSGENGEVTFENELENGLKVVKRYRFHPEDDIIDIDVEVQNPTSKEVRLHTFRIENTSPLKN